MNVTAGAQRTSYWSKDHLLDKRRDAKDVNFARPHQLLSKNYDISRTITQNEYDTLTRFTNAEGQKLDDVMDSPYYLERFVEEALNLQKHSLDYAGFRSANGQGSSA